MSEIPGRGQRPTVRMVAAWCAGDSKRTFADAHQAYFEIAKQIVTAKYPPWIQSLRYVDYRDIPDGAVRKGWTHALADRRALKARELFYELDDEGDYVGFDGEKWKRFVRRVARFIAFVDRRLAELGRHADANLTEDRLEQQSQYAENRGVAFLELSARLRRNLEDLINQRLDAQLRDL